MPKQFLSTLRTAVFAASLTVLTINLSIHDARAQTEPVVDPTTMNREERQAERAQVMDERQTARQEDRAERRQLLSEQFHERFLNLFDNAMKRVEAAIARLEHIAGRLESRIEKLSVLGADVSTPSNTLAQARAKITSAKALFVNARVAGEAALSSETPREDFQNARAQFHVATAELREAFATLRQVVSEMKVVIRTLDSQPGVSPAVSDQSLDNAANSAE